MKCFFKASLWLFVCISIIPLCAKRALIIGITGQDGSYLAELLIEKGYEVHGVKRRASSLNTQRIDHLYDAFSRSASPQLILHYGDLVDPNSILTIIAKVQPDEIYNLGAQSHVQVSFEIPVYTAHVDALGTLHILEAVRALGMEKKVKIYQASTSELYGLVQEVPQTERTPFYPRSPYGVAKLYALWIVINYREAYKIFAVNGILFNHESPRRGETFVTRKIAHAVARIANGYDEVLSLGNLNAERDWGHARDYVYAMWLMLQQDTPRDFVIATGQKHSVREFVQACFAHVGMNILWQGSGKDEVGLDAATGRVLVRINERYFRPAEVDQLQGDATLAATLLGWKATVTFDELVREMMDSELTALA